MMNAADAPVPGKGESDRADAQSCLENTVFGGEDTRMLQLGICDDNPVLCAQAAKWCESYLRDTLGHSCSVRRFETAAALRSALNGTSFDILLLDIELDHQNSGIELASEINKLAPATRIIFMTGYHKYYMDVYDATHVYYVEKDHLQELLPKALDKCLEQKERDDQDVISLKYKGKVSFVHRQEILYVEKQLRLARYHLTDGRDLFAYKNFRDIIEELGREQFVQCHRSYLVNLRAVVRIEGNEAVLKEASRVPIGSIYRRDLLKKIVHAGMDTKH
jgi:DNA-binding LytR/AlgR family response regulator